MDRSINLSEPSRAAKWSESFRAVSEFVFSSHRQECLCHIFSEADIPVCLTEDGLCNGSNNRDCLEMTHRLANQRKP